MSEDKDWYNEEMRRQFQVITRKETNKQSYMDSLSKPIRNVNEHVKCKFCGNDVQRDYQKKTCDKCRQLDRSYCHRKSKKKYRNKAGLINYSFYYH